VTPITPSPLTEQFFAALGMGEKLAFKLLEKHEMARRSMRGIDPGGHMGRRE